MGLEIITGHCIWILLHNQFLRTFKGIYVKNLCLEIVFPGLIFGWQMKLTIKKFQTSLTSPRIKKN